MINNRFENQKEIYQALLYGEKVTQEWLPKGFYIHLKDGLVVDDVGKISNVSFYDCAEWSLYQEPKKVTKHYRWLCKNCSNVYYVSMIYLAEGDLTQNGVKRLDDDFILVDEDNNLIEQ